MDLQELGQYLKDEREGQGLTLEEVSKRTRISLKVLECIEAGDMSSFPHPVYAKGFVKNYARLLKLDAEELGEAVAKLHGVDDRQYSKAPREASRGQSTTLRTAGTLFKRQRKTPYLVLVLAILISVVLWLLISSLKSDKLGQALLDAGKQTAQLKREPDKAPAAQSADKPASDKPAPLQEKTLQDKPAPVEAKKDVKAAEPAKPEPAPATSVPFDAIAHTSTPPQQPQAGGGEKQFGNGKHFVEIAAREPCWLQASFDGGAIREFYLHKDQKLVIRYEDKMSVKLGNAGGVDIKHDGKEFSQGSGKNVKTIQFPAGN